MNYKRRHYNIPVFIPHLGCPYNCIYCDQKKISAQLNVPGEDETREIIEKHLETIPVAAEVEIAFFGGNFTSVPVELQYEYLQAANPYIKSGRVNSIRISTRPDCIDQAELTLLHKWGVKTIELGVQSLDDKVLKASSRGYLAEDVFKASRLIKKEDFKLGIQLMIGLPGDSPEADIETANRTISLEPDMVRIYPTLVINGTILDSMYRQGAYTPLKLSEAIHTAMHMFLLFQKQGVDVIRMGLQPGEELRSSGTVTAGPFHPSFGELVEQEIFKEQTKLVIEKLFSIYAKYQSLTLYVNPRDISKLIGNRRSNMVYLQELFGCNMKVKALSGNDLNWIGASPETINKPVISMDRKQFIDLKY